jgi:hypothetical protein
MRTHIILEFDNAGHSRIRVGNEGSRRSTLGRDQGRQLANRFPCPITWISLGFLLVRYSRTFARIHCVPRRWTRRLPLPNDSGREIVCDIVKDYTLWNL